MEGEELKSLLAMSLKDENSNISIKSEGAKFSLEDSTVKDNYTLKHSKGQFGVDKRELTGDSNFIYGAIKLGYFKILEKLPYKAFVYAKYKAPPIIARGLSVKLLDNANIEDISQDKKATMLKALSASSSDHPRDISGNKEYIGVAIFDGDKLDEYLIVSLQEKESDIYVFKLHNNKDLFLSLKADFDFESRTYNHLKVNYSKRYRIGKVGKEDDSTELILANKTLESPTEILKYSKDSNKDIIIFSSKAFAK